MFLRFITCLINFDEDLVKNVQYFTVKPHRAEDDSEIVQLVLGDLSKMSVPG